jgi:CheY-like chemotaxis protein
MPNAKRRGCSLPSAALRLVPPSPPSDIPRAPAERTDTVRAVAIIDDYPDNRLLLREVLSERYDVREYPSGPEALEGLPRNLPDVVLCDVSMPGMDGFEVVARIRADPRLRHLPVIAVTAHGPANSERYLESGFSDHIHMPLVDERVLERAIERWASPGADREGAEERGRSASQDERP